MFCHYSHATEKIVPGTYELRSEYDYRAIITAMSYSSASRLTASVTIPEGYTIKQIFTLLEQKGVCAYDDLVETAATHEYNFSFLKDVPLGDAARLEGYLFPDTYEFYLGENPLYVINKMLVHVPGELLHYVMIHEFTHLLYPNHGKEFHAFMKQCLPELKNYENFLKNYSFLLRM
jgi:UPF0755 protein